MIFFGPTAFIFSFIKINLAAVFSDFDDRKFCFKTIFCAPSWNACGFDAAGFAIHRWSSGSRCSRQYNFWHSEQTIGINWFASQSWYEQVCFCLFTTTVLLSKLVFEQSCTVLLLCSKQNTWEQPSHSNGKKSSLLQSLMLQCIPMLNSAIIINDMWQNTIKIKRFYMKTIVKLISLLTFSMTQHNI